MSSADATYTSEGGGDYAGHAVAIAGDVNADGCDDLLIGAYRNNAGAVYAGAAYVVLSGGTPANEGLADAAARSAGDVAYGSAGNSVAAAGDVDDDGFADLIIGAPEVDYYSSAGTAYVVRGGASPVSETLDAADAAYTGIRSGIPSFGPGDQAGFAVSGAGDINSDGGSRTTATRLHANIMTITLPSPCQKPTLHPGPSTGASRSEPRSRPSLIGGASFSCESPAGAGSGRRRSSSAPFARRDARGWHTSRCRMPTPLA